MILSTLSHSLETCKYCVALLFHAERLLTRFRDACNCQRPVSLPPFYSTLLDPLVGVLTVTWSVIHTASVWTVPHRPTVTRPANSHTRPEGRRLTGPLGVRRAERECNRTATRGRAAINLFFFFSVEITCFDVASKGHRTLVTLHNNAGWNPQNPQVQ